MDNKRQVNKPPENEANKVLEEYLDLKMSGGKDDDLLARARPRADEIRDEMAAKYGHRKIAVELIRQARGEAEDTERLDGRANLNDSLAKIELQQLWSYFHKDWLIEIRSQIRRQLPDTHYVFIESETTLIAPETAEVDARSMPDEIYSQYSLIIGRWHENKIIAALEMLSPLNKGIPSRFDREMYLRKRDSYLESGVNFLEIDALTTGESVSPNSISKAAAFDRHAWTCYHDAGVPRVDAYGWNSDQAMPTLTWRVERDQLVTIDLCAAATTAVEFNRWQSLVALP